MGVMLPDGLNNTLNLDTETLCQDIKQINHNSMYRHSDVYKECSYPDFVSHKSFFTKARRTRSNYQSKKVCNLKKNKIDIDQELSKVYKSPSSKRNCVQKPLITDGSSFNPTEYKLVCTVELQKKVNDQADTGTPEVIGKDLLVVTPDIDNRCVWRKVWPKVMFPKFLCPCCTGGSDSGEAAPAADGATELPYKIRSPVESYETVDLTRNSNIAIQPLNLDASLQSILNLRGRLRPKNVPRKCVNMLINVLRNTYKNAALIVTQHRS